MSNAFGVLIKYSGIILSVAQKIDTRYSFNDIHNDVHMISALSGSA